MTYNPLLVLPPFPGKKLNYMGEPSAKISYRYIVHLVPTMYLGGGGGPKYIPTPPVIGMVGFS